MLNKKSRIPLSWPLGCRFPGCIVYLGVIPNYTVASIIKKKKKNHPQSVYQHRALIQLVECRYVNPEVVGSGPALINVHCSTQIV